MSPKVWTPSPYQRARMADHRRQIRLWQEETAQRQRDMEEYDRLLNHEAGLLAPPEEPELDWWERACAVGGSVLQMRAWPESAR